MVIQLYSRTLHLLRIQFNILPSLPKSSKWSLQVSQLQFCMYISPLACYVPTNLILILPDLIFLIIPYLEKSTNYEHLTMQLLPAYHYFLPLRSECSPQTLFSNTITLCSSLDVRNHVSHHTEHVKWQYHVFYS
jgi:hypothetical protein